MTSYPCNKYEQIMLFYFLSVNYFLNIAVTSEHWFLFLNTVRKIYIKIYTTTVMVFYKDIYNIPIVGLHMTSSKHDYANYDRFVSNFDMAYKTIKRVSVPNLKSFGPKKTELWAKEVGDFETFLCYVMWENGLGAFSYPPS